eukprot:330900-Rhodomonas_salina.4
MIQHRNEELENCLNRTVNCGSLPVRLAGTLPGYPAGTVTDSHWQPDSVRPGAVVGPSHAGAGDWAVQVGPVSGNSVRASVRSVQSVTVHFKLGKGLITSARSIQL